MKYSNYYIPTFRENPADAEIPSQAIALRGGYIKKIAIGIYDYLPLGLRVIRKVEKIIREEMNKKGAIEVLMPSMVPAELWQKSGRWFKYGKELLRIKDRAGREYCYGPTHEEVIVDLVSDDLKSYKQLPINLYQIQNKFRDEIRPRFGLMRAREFSMKDAYSFHADEQSLDITYKDMHEAYTNIFARCGLDYRVVSADSGAIGGNSSQEFMIVAETGEDEILYCTDCDHAANIEKSSTKVTNKSEPILGKEKVHTPDIKAIEDVAEFLGVGVDKTIKAVAYKYDKEIAPEKVQTKYVMVFIRGDYEVNEVKLANKLDALGLEPATEEEIVQVFNTVPGFMGFVSNKGDYQVIVDDSILGMCNVVIGANEKDYHFKNANIGRDFEIEESSLVDVKTVNEGDDCLFCSKGTLKKERGIEVGHIFKLGTKYSKAMDATFLDQQGKVKPFIMGCYGIGVGRTAMAAIEQHHDDNGPLWPISIAPFEVIVLPVNLNKEEQVKISDDIYTALSSKGIDVLYDDRDERLGVKMNDADLIGSPYRVIVGKRAIEGIVELSFRNGDAKIEMTEKELIVFLIEKIKGE